MSYFRNSDNQTITIIIREKRESIPLPPELQQVTSVQSWDDRIRAVEALCGRYGKPMFERIHFIVSVLALIIVPLALQRVIFRAITPKAIQGAIDRGDDFPSSRFDGDSRSAERYIFESRMITLAIFVAIWAIFWIPMIMWKVVGAKQAKSLASRFTKEDEARGAAFVPRWTIKSPSMWSNNGRILVTIPQAAPPSFFNSQAYLPPYMIAPPAGPPPAGYPAYPGGPVPGYVPGQVPPVQGGALPPNYVQPQDGLPELDFVSADEKRRPAEYEDIKV